MRLTLEAHLMDLKRPVGRKIKKKNKKITCFTYLMLFNHGYWKTLECLGVFLLFSLLVLEIT